MRRLHGDKDQGSIGCNRATTTPSSSTELPTHIEDTINIDELNVGGEVVRNPEDIKKEITTFYQNLYSEIEAWRHLQVGAE